MKIGGHRLIEHIRLLLPVLSLVTGVWLLRWIVSASGAPVELTKLVSLTTTTGVSTILAVLLIRSRGYGGYASVVLASFIISAWAQFLIVAAITYASVTQKNNVYTLPIYSLPARDVTPLEHIYEHLTSGIGMGTIVSAGVGCLLMWLLRKMIPAKNTAAMVADDKHEL
jgi:hypothetical protein